MPERKRLTGTCHASVEAAVMAALEWGCKVHFDAVTNNYQAEYFGHHMTLVETDYSREYYWQQ